MISLLKKLFGSKPAEVAQSEAAPYKVEVQPEPTPVVEKAAVQSVPKPAKKPAPKKPAAKKAPRKPKASKPQA